MNATEGLNDQQRQAVRTTEGPLLLLAGAGSGKTKTLTHRIGYLITEKQVYPSRILAVTFTNKAAREMRQRLAELVGASADDRQFMPWMGTFHSVCVRMLRRSGAAVGVPSNFIIYDEGDRQALVKQAMKACGITDRDIKPRAIISVISSTKNDLLSGEMYREDARTPFEQKVGEVFVAYERMLTQAGALDFDDILVKMVQLLQDHPEALR